RCNGNSDRGAKHHFCSTKTDVIGRVSHYDGVAVPHSAWIKRHLTQETPRKSGSQRGSGEYLRQACARQLVEAGHFVSEITGREFGELPEITELLASCRSGGRAEFGHPIAGDGVLSRQVTRKFEPVPRWQQRFGGRLLIGLGRVDADGNHHLPPRRARPAKTKPC